MPSISLSKLPDPYLIELQAWTGVGVETLRYSTHPLTIKSADSPANTYYGGRIKDPGGASLRLFEGGTTSGKASVDYGYVELINADGKLDPLINYGYGRPIVIKSLATRDAPVAGAVVELVATVVGIYSSDPLRTLRLRYRSRLAELDKPLLTARYAGTTTTTGPTAEGGADLKDQLKPGAWGVNLNVPGKLVNEFDLFYQFAANAQSTMTVKEGGVVRASVGDFPALSSLRTATVGAGQCATCLTQGIARFGGKATLPVTADLFESAAGARSGAFVASRMLAQFGIAAADIDTATSNALHSFNLSEVGIYVDNDASAIDAISRVLDSIGGVLVSAFSSGVFQFVAIGEPSASVADTFTFRDMISEGTDADLFNGPSSDGQGNPAWRVVVNYGRVWQTQTPGDLYGAVTSAQRAFLGSATRQAVAQDASVKTAFPLASELTFETLLVDAAAAQAEAMRRLNLYKRRRDRLSFPTFKHRGGVALGRSVKVQMDRLGYAGGKNFLVIGRAPDFARNLITLTLWG
jgi:hypothetical protein